MTKGKCIICNKVWKLSTADRKFSDFIRSRDKKCLKCGRSDRQLQCSHFWDRQHYATRFDPDNCITLCAWCHNLGPDNWEQDRYGEYRAFMIKWLGKKKFGELEETHIRDIRNPYKKRKAIVECMALLKAID